MSIIVQFFTAPDDQAAAAILDTGPASTPEVLTFGNFDAIAAIEEWDSILTGRSAEELRQDDVPHIIAGESPLVIATSAALQRALISVTPEQLAVTARQWIEQEELRGYDPELFTEILGELAALASTAAQEGNSLYCWMC